MRAFIVRHGNTFAAGEAPRRIGARTDLPLVDSGREQVAALARHFAASGITFDRCLSGPLRRTRETAAILLPTLTTEIADWLDEIDHGPDEGMSEDAVIARIGAGALAAWGERAAPPPGWHVDAERRIAGWRAFFADAQGDILLATSNGAARYARVALGLAPAPLRTGSYGEIAGAAGTARLVRWSVPPRVKHARIATNFKRSYANCVKCFVSAVLPPCPNPCRRKATRSRCARSA